MAMATKTITSKPTTVARLFKDGWHELRSPLHLGTRSVIAVTLALGCLGDLLTTTIGLYFHGSSEGNPVAAFGISQMGFPFLILSQLIMLGLLLPILLATPRRSYDRFLQCLCACFCGLKLDIVLHNLLVLIHTLH
jgi:hypothetical protein